MKLGLVTLHTAATLVGMLAATACGPSQPTVSQQAGVSLYAAELLRCVEQAPTRYDADNCRREVEARYSDGGAK